MSTALLDSALVERWSTVLYTESFTVWQSKVAEVAMRELMTGGNALLLCQGHPWLSLPLGGRSEFM
ncbi:MAG: hypothetical protein ACK8QZ_04125 [Anaerolineales bacterium]